jgi:hypothetical protein
MSSASSAATDTGRLLVDLASLAGFAAPLFLIVLGSR